jgi:hypothetical protein
MLQKCSADPSAYLAARNRGTHLHGP